MLKTPIGEILLLTLLGTATFLMMFLTDKHGIPAMNQIIEISKLQEIENLVELASTDTILFLDIDDTIIVPKANMFRWYSTHRHFIDEIKKNRLKIENSENIISTWRLNRKVRLVNEGWPELINNAKAKGLKVFALTLMESGKVGQINSMEEWRYNELKALGIEFTPLFDNKEDVMLLEATDSNHATNMHFHKGLLLTGSFTKAETIQQYFKAHKKAPIILVDDRADHIKNVSKICRQLNIPYTGIIYRGSSLIDGQPDNKIITLQKSHLLNSSEWLEDEEAAKLLN